MRIAAIDIGTNSVRSTIVEVPVGGPRMTLDDEKAYTRLGRGTAGTGRLSEEAVEDTIGVLGRMLQIAGQHCVTHRRVIATAAVRMATNGQDFVDRVRDELGVEVDVVSEEEEGRFAFLSAAESVGLDGRSAVIDIGGGSVEIVRATDRQIESIVSLPLGAVLMSERYHTVDPIPARDLKRLTKHVRRSLVDALGDDPDPVGTLVGSGGTVTAVAAVVAAKREPGLASLHTFELRRDEVTHLRAAFAASDAAARALTKGLPPGRVDIILAGTVVLDEIMRILGANELVVNARGIREGVVIDTVERERGSAAPFDRMQSVREFARRCHADQPHAEQVCRLSLALFDALAPMFALDAEDRHLLETAALLHDVGYHIAYERHHKHSHHLISYAELPGFSGKDHRLIAAIARYHRGALPKARHEGMHDLSAGDRRRVERIAAFLRLADGLDRSRGQRVRDMQVTANGSRVAVFISGVDPLEVEVYGAQRKADLLERALGVRVDVVEIVSPDPDEGVTASADGRHSDQAEIVAKE